jgi:hypothetical protein
MDGESEAARARRLTMGEFLDVTADEEAAVQRHLDMLQSGKDRELWVHPELLNSLIAQGLWFYAEELVMFEADPSNGGDSEKYLKAAQALMKSLKLFPVPMVMYRVGVMLDAIGKPEAKTMFRFFLDTRRTFQATEAQGMLLAGMHDVMGSRWDEQAATVDAQRRLHGQ